MEAQTFPRRLILTFAASLLLIQGCTHGIVRHRTSLTRNAIPAHRLPEELRAPARDNLVPLEFTRLRRKPVRDHVVGPRDVLGIYIEDVLAVKDQLPPVFYPRNSGTDQLVQVPSVGHPISVRPSGEVVLPLIGKLEIAGLTLAETSEKIRDAYESESIITDQTFVSVDLIRPRTIKVFVVREDAGGVSPILKSSTNQVLTKRGSATVLEMPAFENDVLHALSQTGGLPGADAFNEIWVLRGNGITEDERHEIISKLQQDPESALEGRDRSRFVRIPLTVCPGQELPFTIDDVVLHDGDVVYIESREVEYFTTGGLISGGKYALPRDHDTDVLEALAIANANIVGPAGNSTATNFRSGPGNIVAPTTVVVVRQLPNGEQIKIAVDLKVAVNDPNERIKIMPRDVLILKYRPSELLANIALNFVNFNYAIPSN